VTIGGLLAVRVREWTQDEDLEYSPGTVESRPVAAGSRVRELLEESVQRFLETTLPRKAHALLMHAPSLLSSNPYSRFLASPLRSVQVNRSDFTRTVTHRQLQDWHYPEIEASRRAGLQARFVEDGFPSHFG